MMNPCFLVDTTLCGVGLAIADRQGGQIIWSGMHTESGRATAVLTELAAEACLAADVDISAVSTICVANGPGSFTGIRVGLAWAYGMRAADSSVHLIGYSGLAAAGHGLSSQPDRGYVLVLPSTRTHGYVSYGTWGEVKLALVDLNQADQRQALADWCVNRDTALVGAWPMFEEWADSSGQTIRQVSQEEAVQASLMGSWKELQSGLLTQKLDTDLRPFYLREPTAVERKKGKKL